MEQLVQDLTTALQESEYSRPTTFKSSGSWCNMRRRTRSAGNLYLYFNKSAGDNSDGSSSSTTEINVDHRRKSSKFSCLHQSDSDDISLSVAVTKALEHKNSLRMRQGPIHSLIRGVSHSLESDSVNEHSPARPNYRRKRKLKRMSIDETPVLPCGKRKRSQRCEILDGSTHCRHHMRIKPLHQSVVDKIEKFCHPSAVSDDPNKMDIEDNCEAASESSISWSGGEGHEGDDELTDWAPSLDTASAVEANGMDADPREVRAGCRRIRDERPSFSVISCANERVARFLQDPSKKELRIGGVEREKLVKLATLYSLDLRWEAGPGVFLLRKTIKTPFMRPTQRHHSGLSSIHKRIRTERHIIS